MIGYCMKCKSAQEMKDAKETTLKNGRPAIIGVCSVCGTKMCKMVAKK